MSRQSQETEPKFIPFHPKYDPDFRNGFLLPLAAMGLFVGSIVGWNKVQDLRPDPSAECTSLTYTPTGEPDTYHFTADLEAHHGARLQRMAFDFTQSVTLDEDGKVVGASYHDDPKEFIFDDGEKEAVVEFDKSFTGKEVPYFIKTYIDYRTSEHGRSTGDFAGCDVLIQP